MNFSDLSDFTDKTEVLSSRHGVFVPPIVGSELAEENLIKSREFLRLPV